MLLYVQIVTDVSDAYSYFSFKNVIKFDPNDKGFCSKPMLIKSVLFVASNLPPHRLIFSKNFYVLILNFLICTLCSGMICCSVPSFYFQMICINGARAGPGYFPLGGAKEKNQRLVAATPILSRFSFTTILLFPLLRTSADYQIKSQLCIKIFQAR